MGIATSRSGIRRCTNTQLPDKYLQNSSGLSGIGRRKQLPGLTAQRAKVSRRLQAPAGGEILHTGAQPCECPRRESRLGSSERGDFGCGRLLRLGWSAEYVGDADGDRGADKRSNQVDPPG